MKGIDTYKTKSGFMVAKVHYSADPDKDPSTEEGRRWIEQALIGVPGGMSSSSWRKEMEIDFSARSGKRVFDGLEQMRDRIMIKPFSLEHYQDVNGGYDWGKRNPYAYVEGTVDPDGVKYLVYGASSSGVEVRDQAEFIKRSPYAEKVRIRYADPSIWTENQVSLYGGYTSLQRIFSELGVTFTKGRTDDIACMERLTREWYDTTITPDGSIVQTPKENPTLKIFEPLEFLWQSLCNLRWSEFSPAVEVREGKKEEIAHAGNDPWDAFKYWYLSLPQRAEIPKLKSLDPALPLAGDLISQDENLSPYRRWMK